MSFQGMKFCRECNNMLYPREFLEEGNTRGTLNFYCRNCKYCERAQPKSEVENCIYRNEINLQASNMIIDRESCLDPTLPRTKDVVCEKCGFEEAVFFQTPGTNYETGMRLIFVCANYDKAKGKACGNWWYQKIRGEKKNKDMELV